MKILKQVMIIGTITFVGELCNLLVPLPVPASIYGMVLLFVCLQTGVIKLSQIEETADFLITVMPVMFVAPCVSLMDAIGGVKDSVLAIVLICLFTTVTTMSVTGVTAQTIIRIRKRREVKAGFEMKRENRLKDRFENNFERTGLQEVRYESE